MLAECAAHEVIQRDEGELGERNEFNQSKQVERIQKKEALIN